MDNIPANAFNPNKPLETTAGLPVRRLGSVASLTHPHAVAVKHPDGSEALYCVDADGKSGSPGLPDVVSVVSKTLTPCRLTIDSRHVKRFEFPGDGRLGGTEVLATFDLVFVGWQFTGFENVRTDVDPDPR